MVHPRRNVEVNQMLTVGDGVWVSFKNESILRLFHATSFTHMQDIDVGPVVHKVLGKDRLHTDTTYAHSILICVQHLSNLEQNMHF